MAKSKPASKPSKGDKAITAVKTGAVTKSAQAPKAKSKVIAKETAKKASSKKVKEPESSEEEDDDDSDSSESEASGSDSDSSDSESEVVNKKAVTNGKVNGKAKKAPSDDDDSEEDSDSESSEEEEEVEKKVSKPAVNGKAKTNGASAKQADSDDSSDESDSSSDEAPAKAAKADESEDDSDDSESSDSDEEPKATKAGEASDSDSDSDSSASEEDSDKEEADQSANKKRKAEEVATPQAKKQKSTTEDTPQSKNLFVGSLSWNIDDAWLRQEFEKFGEIIRANVMTDRESGRSRGFGYVEFTNLEDAIKAHKEMTEATIDGRTINVDFSFPRDASTPNQRQQQRGKSFGDQPSEPSDTLFVGNIAFDADETIITEAFAVHAQVRSVRLPTRPEDGTPKGFGYVTFSSVEEATKAFDSMQGAYIASRPIRLDYSQPRQQNNDSPRGSRGGFGGRGRGRGDFGGRGRGGRGDSRGGRGGRGGFSTNRGGFGAATGKKIAFD